MKIEEVDWAKYLLKHQKISKASAIRILALNRTAAAEGPFASPELLINAGWDLFRLKPDA